MDVECVQPAAPSCWVVRVFFTAETQREDEVTEGRWIGDCGLKSFGDVFLSVQKPTVNNRAAVCCLGSKETAIPETLRLCAFAREIPTGGFTLGAGEGGLDLLCDEDWFAQRRRDAKVDFVKKPVLLNCRRILTFRQFAGNL